MTNQQHQIIPPPELVAQWLSEHYDVVCVAPGEATSHVANQAARWGADQQLKLDVDQIAQAYQAGADQELEACLKWVSENCRYYDDCSRPEDELRIARRPKPPSVKEQALEALQFVDEKLDLPLHNHCNAIHTIRRALEALPND